MGGNSGVAEKGIPDTMMADGNLPPFLETSSALASFPEPPRSISISRTRVHARKYEYTRRRDKRCVCNSSRRRWKKFRGNDRGNESGPSEIVDLLSRVGGGFEFAVNRKLSVPRTHKTCTPRIRTLFHGLRPTTSLTKFQRRQEFCVVF